MCDHVENALDDNSGVGDGVNAGRGGRACMAAEVHTPATWVGAGNKLVVSGHTPAARHAGSTMPTLTPSPMAGLLSR